MVMIMLIVVNGPKGVTQPIFQNLQYYKMLWYTMLSVRFFDFTWDLQCVQSLCN